MRPKGCTDWLAFRRFRAVALLEQGGQPGLIARILGVSRGSLYRWQRMAQAGALQAKPHLGPPKRLTDHDYKKLEELLLEGALGARVWLAQGEPAGAEARGFR